ncbi:hypothetical protein IE53DRAFT_288111 [Violaceomyces palustris]|uniref:Uncharacterized protein n=1 Tax=Violaceomyces palustris TaxID=1673888 RepID=A0ACD0P2N9_9BASI|nr:hypothetical protein IE53DRAFT_288111 [Violaceomyces palustris]
MFDFNLSRILLLALFIIPDESHNVNANPLHSSSRSSPSFDILDAKRDDGYWFAKVHVGEGNGKGLKLLIDTGSPFVILKPQALPELSIGSGGSGSADLDFLTKAGPDGQQKSSMNVEFHKVDLKLGSLSVAGQKIGLVHGQTPIPGDGILGLSLSVPPGASQIMQGPTVLQGLCASDQLSSCYFGTGFCADGSGKLLLGTNRTSPGKPAYVESEAAKFSSKEGVGIDRPWYIHSTGDKIMPRVGSQTLPASDSFYVFDSGSEVTIGPIEQVKKIFLLAGIEYHEKQTDLGKWVYGLYDCNIALPSIGFELWKKFFPFSPSAIKYSSTDDGSQHTDGAPATDFTTSASGFFRKRGFAERDAKMIVKRLRKAHGAMEKRTTATTQEFKPYHSNGGGGKCLTSIFGSDTLVSKPNFWILGQNFYVDKLVFHGADATITVAPILEDSGIC